MYAQPHNTQRMLDPKAEIARRTSELNVTRMTQKYVEAEVNQAPNVEMLRTFAEITYTLHQVNMEMLEIKDMFHVLDDSLNIMDECFDCFESLVSNHMFSSKDAAKTEKAVKQFTKGVSKKIKEMFHMLKSVTSISEELSGTLSTLRAPGFKKKKAKKAKKGEAPALSPFEAYIAEFRAKKYGDVPSPSAPAGAAPSGGDLSDVSDITGDI